MMPQQSDTTRVLSTDRPVLRVRDVIEMETVRQGAPRMLTGELGLDMPVRWVHVASDADVAHLLSGGELILTTAAGWPRDTAAIVHEVSRLIDANISGLFIELGKRFESIPNELVALCTSREVTLVALEREASFVRITEQVHRAILSEQSEALAARDEVQAMLTTLGLNRAPVDFVVEQLSTELQTPVVLENTLGEVISWAAPSHRDSPREVLTHWPRATGVLPPGWDAVPVAARDVRWGQLIALPGPPHPAGRLTVLELGSVALALGRLADPLERADRWMSTNAKRLLDDLLAGRYRSDDEISAQLTSAGLSLDSNHVAAFTIETERDLATVLEAIHLALGDSVKVVVAPSRDGSAPSMGLVAVPRSSGKPGIPSTRVRKALGRTLDDALRAKQSEDDGSASASRASGRVFVTIGPDASTISELVTSIESALTLQDSAALYSGSIVSLSVVETQPLAMLVSELKHDERLNRFAQRVLAPLLDYDERNDGDLVRVLSAYLRHPTNRSQAASAANLSRSVFYQRLDMIESVLAADLTDGTTLATLTLALQVAPHLAAPA